MNLNLYHKQILILQNKKIFYFFGYKNNQVLFKRRTHKILENIGFSIKYMKKNLF